jgi:Ca2+-binding EF-hand superfamily protein
MNYGVLADLEKLQELLNDTLGQFALLKDALGTAEGNAKSRQKRNAQLRNRLESVKDQVSKDMNDLFSSMMGVRPEDVLTDEEIDKHLTDAFNKFDTSKDGKLGEWEFTQAWFFLGLKGSEDEIAEAFKSVDADNSGLVDLSEFKKAIKSERLTELNLGHLLEKMGVQLHNIDGKFDAFKATETRRRLMKKEYEEKIKNLTKVIINKLSSLSSKPLPARDAKKEKMYNTIRDTFNAFDADGSRQLGFPEYKEAWKFLNRPGTDPEIKKTFDSVDVDGTGTVEWAEFVFTLMGKDALEFGALADLEVLSGLLDDTAGILSSMKGDLDAAGKDADAAGKDLDDASKKASEDDADAKKMDGDENAAAKEEDDAAAEEKAADDEEKAAEQEEKAAKDEEGAAKKALEDGKKEKSQSGHNASADKEREALCPDWLFSFLPSSSAFFAAPSSSFAAFSSCSAAFSSSSAAFSSAAASSSSFAAAFSSPSIFFASASSSDAFFDASSRSFPAASASLPAASKSPFMEDSIPAVSSNNPLNTSKSANAPNSNASLPIRVNTNSAHSTVPVPSTSTESNVFLISGSVPGLFKNFHASLYSGNPNCREPSASNALNVSLIVLYIFSFLASLAGSGLLDNEDNLLIITFVKFLIFSSYSFFINLLRVSVALNASNLPSMLCN